MFGYVGTTPSHDKQGNLFVPVHCEVTIGFLLRIWLSTDGYKLLHVAASVFPQKAREF